MNKSIKRIIPTLALLSVALLASCNSSTTSQEHAYEGDPYEVPTDYVAFTGAEKDLTAKVTYWNTFNKATTTLMQGYADAFHALYPNITIELVNKGGYPQINSAINDAITSGTTPTMAICYPDHVADYLSAGASENMAGYIKDPIIGLGVEDLTGAGALSDFVPSYLEEGINYTEKGVFSMPWSKSTEIMFYNKTMFEDKGWTVPTTWKEAFALAKTIKADTSIEGIDAVTPFGYDSDDNLFITYCAQAGLKYTSAKEPHYVFNNDGTKNFVNTLVSEHSAGHFLTKGSSANGAYTSTQFTNKTLFFTVGSTGGTTFNYTDKFEVGVAGIPQVDTNKPKVISQGPSVTFFKRSTAAEKQAAWLFYKFCTNAKNSANWAISTTGYNPVRTSSYSDSVWTTWKASATTGKNKLLLDVANYCETNYAAKNAYFTSPVFTGSSKARTAVGGLVASVLNGTKDVDTAFSDAIASCVA
jgi:multiple sugar transport system substrate-binding protein